MLSNFLNKLSEKVANQSDLIQGVLLIQVLITVVVFALVSPVMVISLAVSFGIVYFSGNE